ncbi:MAG: hypothetical protein BTN85_0418 [Candidatus Methanohalarchaeum thermophilum]|uniref:Uncharacterized protein n=1 Tax=Methanohalarchaeum thermophilum TaxID=1903181 RepID=A0A1Q6DU97_METT1|nr:MAG: hypothetical protein BTN85_0418 [Candidatus Methanohalarchaeum thermophilum]
MVLYFFWAWCFFFYLEDVLFGGYFFSVLLFSFFLGSRWVVEKFFWGFFWVFWFVAVRCPGINLFG